MTGAAVAIRIIEDLPGRLIVDEMIVAIDGLFAEVQLTGAHRAPDAGKNGGREVDRVDPVGEVGDAVDVLLRIKRGAEDEIVAAAEPIQAVIAAAPVEDIVTVGCENGLRGRRPGECHVLGEVGGKADDLEVNEGAAGEGSRAVRRIGEFEDIVNAGQLGDQRVLALAAVGEGAVIARAVEVLDRDRIVALFAAKGIGLGAADNDVLAIVAADVVIRAELTEDVLDTLELDAAAEGIGARTGLEVDDGAQGRFRSEAIVISENKWIRALAAVEKDFFSCQR